MTDEEVMNNPWFALKYYSGELARLGGRCKLKIITEA